MTINITLQELKKSIRRLFAKEVFEVSAGTIVFYCQDANAQPRFLLIERGHPYNDWVFPKGKIEPGEPLKQAALRETEEETGLKVHIYHEIASYSYTYYWDPTNEKATKTVHYFLARSNADKPQPNGNSNGEARTFKQIKFVTANEAANLVKHQIEVDIIRQAEQEVTTGVFDAGVDSSHSDLQKLPLTSSSG